jgi:hypothetical protein
MIANPKFANPVTLLWRSIVFGNKPSRSRWSVRPTISGGWDEASYGITLGCSPMRWET